MTSSLRQAYEKHRLGKYGEIKPPAPDKGMGGLLRDAGLSLAKGVVAVPEAVVGLADIATRRARGQGA